MKDKPCEWCPDDTCSSYWKVQVFDRVHIICNCCYTHLKEVSQGSYPITRQTILEIKELEKEE